MIDKIQKSNIKLNQAKIAFIKRQGCKYKPIVSYLDIFGFISENEAIALYNLVKSIKSRNPVVVEIGSLIGRSSFILARGIIKKKNAVLYCIDPFKADKNSKSKSIRSLKKIIPNLKYKNLFTENMKRHKVLKTIKILEGYSHEFASKFRKPIDLLFIDGNHEYKQVLRDFLEWSPYIKKGGDIAMHDVYFRGRGHRGPCMVVQKYLVNTPKKNNESWMQQKLIDCLFVAQKVN